MLAERLGLPPSVNKLFAFLTERWDGKGILDRATGEEIPLPLRIVHTLFRLTASSDPARRR